jgi:hypothetical protein
MGSDKIGLGAKKRFLAWGPYTERNKKCGVNAQKKRKSGQLKKARAVRHRPFLLTGFLLV